MGSKKLIGPWRTIHGAIWLIGLAILFWKGWFWPGILVLVAISAIAEAVIQIAVPSATVQEVQPEEEAFEPSPAVNAPPVNVAPTAAAVVEPERRADLLPAKCPTCGGPVSGDDVKWSGPRSASCPYCGANLPLR